MKTRGDWRNQIDDKKLRITPSDIAQVNKLYGEFRSACRENRQVRKAILSTRGVICDCVWYEDPVCVRVRTVDVNVTHSSRLQNAIECVRVVCMTWQYI